jgi:hypothetical protein
MTRFTTVSVVQSGLEMCGVFEVLFVEVFMAGLASVAPDILGCILVGGSTVVFLCGDIGK